MTVPVHILQGNLSQKNIPGSILRSGSVVSGRVLSSDGNGFSTVSLAGQKISVRTEVPLAVGAEFRATVKIKDGTVSLVLKDSSVAVEKNPVFQIHPDSQQSLPQNAANLLLNLGLEPSFNAFRLLQFVQQMGMKIDSSYLRKILEKSESGKKNNPEDVDRSETKVLLKSKNLPDDDFSVSSVLYDSDRGKKKDGQENGHSNRDEVFVFEQNVSVTEELVKDFFATVDESAATNDIGLLTKFNSFKNDRGGSSSDSHWFVLPFEWPLMNQIGDIRLFFENNLSSLKKIVINSENEMRKKVFSVYFKESRISSVKFALLPEPGSIRSYSDMLVSVFRKFCPENPPVDVECVPYGLLKGYGLEDAEILGVRGEA